MPRTTVLRAPARILLVLVTTLAASFAAGVVTAPAAEAGNLDNIRKAVQVTANQKGDPYSYGAAGPDRFDCSGLVYYAFRKAGFRNVPRTSSQQAGFAKRIKRSNMRRGDLIFFHNGGRVYHVGVYGGRNKKNGNRFMIHAPYGNGVVERSPMWTNSWFPGTLRKRG